MPDEKKFCLVRVCNNKGLSENEFCGSRRRLKPTFIWARTSINWLGGMPAKVWLMLSSVDVPGGLTLPGGRLARNDSGSFEGLREPPLDLGSEGPGTPPSRSSPLTVVFPSRNGSESARSIRRGRPPTSVPFRFRTAERAVSWSCGG